MIARVGALFGATILLSACAAGAQAVPEGWHKYTDARFGFEIAYPDEYGIVPERGSPPFGAVKRVRFQERQLLSSEFVEVEPPRFAVEVFELGEPTALGDWLRSKNRLPAGASTTAVTLPGAREGTRIQLPLALAPNDFFYFASNRFVYLLTPLGLHARAMFKSFHLLAVYNNGERRPPRSR